MADMVGAERVVADLWIAEAIASVQDELEDIALGLSDRVYADLAPDDAKYPFIVIQCQDDPVDVRGVGTVSIMTNTLYVVKVCAPAAFGPMGEIIALLHRALTTSTGSTTRIGGTVLSCVRERAMSLTEVDRGKVLRHIGGIYELQVQGNDGEETTFRYRPRWWDLTGDQPFPPEAKDNDFGYDAVTGRIWENVL